MKRIQIIVFHLGSFLVLLLLSSCKERNIDSLPKLKQQVNIESEIVQNDTNEVLGGWLKVGITEKLIMTKLGAGHTILSGEYSEVNGYYQEKWEYPEHGVTLLMQSEEPNSDKTVSEITITEPSGLKTSKGIGIGSSKNEICKYYPTANQNGVDDDIIVVGDIYYGLFFTIRDNKVSKIFIGASAE